MFSVKAVFNRSGYPRKDGNAKIHIRFIYLRKPDYYDPDILIHTKHWRKGRVVRRSDAHDLNEEIEDLVRQSMRFYRDCRKNKKPFSIKRLKQHLGMPKEESFITFIENQIERDRHTINPRTIKRYGDIIEKLKLFNGEVYMSDLDYRFMTDFNRWLSKQISIRKKPYSQNYIASIFGHMRKFVTEAIKLDLIDKDPYKGFKSSRAPTTNEVLTSKEIEKIWNFDCSKYHKSREKCRDYFCFLIFTGMRYMDMFLITTINIQDGMLRFVATKTRKRTGKMGRVPMHLYENRAHDLLLKYDGKFPAYSNAQFNRMVKILMKDIGIKKDVCAKTARHTFKTQMQERKYPIHIISEMMAHNSTSMTDRYGSVSDESVMKVV